MKRKTILLLVVLTMLVSTNACGAAKGTEAVNEETAEDAVEHTAADDDCDSTPQRKIAFRRRLTRLRQIYMELAV